MYFVLNRPMQKADFRALRSIRDYGLTAGYDERCWMRLRLSYLQLLAPVPRKINPCESPKLQSFRRTWYLSACEDHARQKYASGVDINGAGSLEHL